MVEEVVVCEDATLRYVTNIHARIEWADGRTEEHDLSSCEPFALRLTCLLYTSPSPRDKRQSRMPSSA